MRAGWSRPPAVARIAHSPHDSFITFRTEGDILTSAYPSLDMARENGLVAGSAPAGADRAKEWIAMSVRKGIGVALLVILAIAVLAVFGFAAYRLGYENGVRAIGQTMMSEGRIPLMERGLMPRVWNRHADFGHLGLMSLPGLLSGLGLAGLVGLAVVGAIHLIAPRPPAAPAQQNPPAGSGRGGVSASS